jgi:hypothetical protein
MKSHSNKKLSPVKSLADLKNKAIKNPIYLKLACIAAEDLGAGRVDNLHQAMNWLNILALECDESTIVKEINSFLTLDKF